MKTPHAVVEARGRRRARLQEWLWDCHSTKQAAGICLLGSSAMGAWCWALSGLSPEAGKPEQYTGTLGTLAQVSGGAFATLVTIVVFAIGLSAQRTDGTSVYTPFVARRFHVFLVVAFSASVALVNTVMPVVGEHVGAAAVRNLLLLNFLLMPAVVILTLLLMCRVIEASSGMDLDSILPVFRSAMRRVATHDTMQEATARKVAERIEGSVIRLQPFAGRSTIFKPKDEMLCGKGVRSLVVDLDLRVLEEILAACQLHADRAEFSLLCAVPASIVGHRYWAAEGVGTSIDW